MNTKQPIDPDSILPEDTYWVWHHDVMAGKYPGSFYPDETREKLITYLDAGVTAFLDLTQAHELEHYEATLRELAGERGIDIAYQRHPVPDVSVPEHPRKMRAILDQIQHWRNENRVVYIHCWGGVGRTGTVVGCLLIESGMTGEEALTHIAELWQQLSPARRRQHPRSPQVPEQFKYVWTWKAGGGK
jgi:predicted protein tyrosine phosphatase